MHRMSNASRVFLVVGAIALCVGSGASAQSNDDLWQGIAKDLFPGRAMTAGRDVVSVQAPAEARDAALVPMTINLEQPAIKVRNVTLVIDANPAPMAAKFTIGPNSGVTMISTRVRVNDFTNVHAVAETTDGALHMTQRYVKGAGGCAAPSVKSMDEALANLGLIKYREIPAGDLGAANRREGQIMIRHPNASGMQMDQRTNSYIPARYIDQVVVKQGDDLLFQMDGGISISEDPNFRFTFVPNGAKALSIEAHDSDGKIFRLVAPLGSAS